MDIQKIERISITIDVIYRLVEFGVKHGPQAIEAIKKIIDLWKNEDKKLTLEEWDELLSKWEKKPEEYFK